MKTYKEQADELIKQHKYWVGRDFISKFIVTEGQIKTLIEAGEYFLQILRTQIVLLKSGADICDKPSTKNILNGTQKKRDEIQESINKLKEAIK
jgi:hypothetical protein